MATQIDLRDLNDQLLQARDRVAELESDVAAVSAKAIAYAMKLDCVKSIVHTARIMESMDRDDLDVLDMLEAVLRD